MANIISCFLITILLVSDVMGFLTRGPGFSPACHNAAAPSSSTTPSFRHLTEDKNIRIPVSSLKNSNNNNYNEGNLTVSRSNGKEYKISYRIARPMSLSSRKAAPIVVLHGGPSVPSNYLYPLEQVVPYRSIIFYDQLGCGNSDEPSDKEVYSIECAVDDLSALIKKLGLRRFHIYGQSFGGILAYEYMKRQAEGEDQDSNNDDDGILSAILSSSPTNVTQVEEEAGKLLDILQNQQKQEDGEDSDMSLEESFRINHQCRLTDKPQPLIDAYDCAGSVWRGSSVISDYVAQPPSDTAKRMPSTMVLRGEHDFVTEACVESWKNIYNHNFVRYKVLKDCSHHGLLENGLLYGDMIDSYFAEYD